MRVRSETVNKPQSLRHALNKAVPYVRNNPDKLHLFVDNGSLVATGASSMSWEYRYTLNVVIEDFSGDQNLLMAPVLLWLRDNQPDAINNPALREKLFTFEVDILRNDVCDISLNGGVTQGGGAMSSNGIVVDAHQHTGVLKGGDTTGGPV
ncbi:TPA: phage tail protein [Escherichia coli]|nr:phage tail protein [Escherichia coli]